MPPPTPLQRRAVDSIMSKMEAYLDMRYRQVHRLNPKVESVWGDLAWIQMTKLRTSLSGDKAFGPVRFHVAELLMSDDYRRVRELFSLKSQASLQGEIVEEKETGAHKTAGQMEIHDMRSLSRAIDPALENVAMLMQTFIWWDLEDGVDTSRFDKKLNMIQALEKHPLTDEMAKYYKEIIQTDAKVTTEEAILYESRMLKRTVENFRLRRQEEQGYQALIAHEQGQGENPDMIIEALGSQMGLLRALRAGQPLDPAIAQQVAKAMNADPATVNSERVVAFLESTTNTNKKRLKGVLAGGGSGEPFNYKARQLEQLDKRLQEIVGDRNLGDVPAVAPAVAG